jgi:hypothetical protein
MLPTVQFDDQVVFLAKEIGDIGRNRMLTAEFYAQLAIADFVPEKLFSFCLVAAELSGNLNSIGHKLFLISLSRRERVRVRRLKSQAEGLSKK